MFKTLNTGVILAGGTGSRLFPLTKVVNKSLLPINGKFIIDYPINTLKDMGCQNIIVILGGPHFDQIVSYLQDGKDFGVNISYVFQGEPSGISQAINVCYQQLKYERHFAVLLGDNIYESPVKFNNPDKYTRTHMHAQIVLKEHEELKRFGVASLKDGKIIKLEEKPKIIDTDYKNFAVSGCYLFDHNFFDLFKQTKKSTRGEYEITHILELYLKNNGLEYTEYKDLWMDAGTFSSIEYLNDFFHKKNR